MSPIWKLAMCAALVVVAESSTPVKKQSKINQGLKKFRTANLLHKNPLKREAICSNSQFACRERCIAASWHCDGEDDCIGGFDESDCGSGCSNNNQFQCSNGHCVPVAYRCDGDNDCGDSSDEAGCSHPQHSCPSYQFQCGTGQCIAGSWRCDGDVDCLDHSDEEGCGGTGGPGGGSRPFSCTQGEFSCTSGACVSQSYVCDGDNDCGDSSDETGCSCTSQQFACDHGGCVPKSYLCDGDNDCSDYSDEKCPDIPDTNCADKLSLADCAHMNTTTYPICTEHADAYKHCRKFCKMCEDFGNSG